MATDTAPAMPAADEVGEHFARLRAEQHPERLHELTMLAVRELAPHQLRRLYQSIAAMRDPQAEKFLAQAPLRPVLLRQEPPEFDNHPLASHARLFCAAGVPKERKVLLVVFAGINGEVFMATPRLLMRLPRGRFDLLRLRHADLLDYPHGVPGFAGSFAALFHRIAALAKGYDAVATLGGSLGGYSALRAAVLLRARHGISLAGRFSDIKWMKAGPPVPGFDPLCTCTPSAGTTLYAFYPTEHRRDARNAEALKLMHPTVQLRPLEAHDHNVLAPMVADGSFDRLIQVTGPTPLARARAAAPAIAAAADAIEAGCELPPALLDLLHAHALFRSVLPARFGGDETHPVEFVRMMEELAAADASTAWCIGQNSVCAMSAAYMDPAAARRIWGDDPRAALAWGAGPQGTAKVVPGGYLVSGRWEFASGGRHATWIGGHSRVQEPDGSLRRFPDGTPVERSMLVPRAQVVMARDWNTMGLRGTGSDSYTMTDLFVPDAHSVTRDNPAERREPGPLYRFSTTNLYASGFGSVALGIARAMLAEFATLAAAKTPQALSRTVRDNPAIQKEMALAQARLAAARALLHATLHDAWDAVAEADAMPLDHRMRIRLAATFATHQAREVADFAYHEAGATAIFAGGGFERRFRDLHTVSQQVQARSAHFETVGAHLLGLAPPMRFI